jgi:hypothetical protein
MAVKRKVHYTKGKVMQPKRRINYIDNKVFYDAIVEHRKKVIEAEKKGLDPPRIPNYIGECIFKIATKLSTMPQFINYSFRDEMISDGIENCILYFHNYDPEKIDPNTGNVMANPFAYFTQVAFFAFVRRINKEERIRYSAHKSFYYTVVHGNVNEYDTMALFDDGEKNLMTPVIYDNISASIEKFEQKEAKRKLKRDEKKKQGLQRFYEEESNE